MTKHLVLLIILSVVAVFFRAELAYVVHIALQVHDHLVAWLGLVFSAGKWGQLIQLSLVLLLIPVVLGLVISGVYWLIKRKKLPCLMEVIWISWFVLLTALAVR